MNILKGFMIFGAIAYMLIAFSAVDKDEDEFGMKFTKNMMGMLICSVIAILINIVC